MKTRGGFLFGFLVSSSLVAFAQGCSSSGSSSAGGACAGYITALRDAAKECGRFNVSPSREGEYIARFQRACESLLAAPGSGISPGVLDQCSAQLRAQCGDDDACEEVLEDVRGSLGEGAACSDDTQCVSGQCRRESTSQVPSTCGKCAAAKQVGEECPEGGCVAGARCVGSSTSGGTTTPPKCVVIRRAAEGETCGIVDGEAVSCASGLNCKLEGASSPGSTGKCTAPAGEGAACGTEESGYANCKAPLSCVNERCGRLGGSGASCQSSNDCLSGFGCDGAKTCAAIVWGPIGATCDNELRRCDRGFCARSGSTTDGTGKCTEYIADGQPCDEEKSTESRCDTYARCINGTCQFEDATQCK